MARSLTSGDAKRVLDRLSVLYHLIKTMTSMGSGNFQVLKEQVQQQTRGNFNWLIEAA